jgi:hypothetical protein
MEIMNKKCQVAGIKLLLSNYKIESDLIDLDSLIDSKISFLENWKLIKNEFVINKFCPCCGQYIT